MVVAEAGGSGVPCKGRRGYSKGVESLRGVGGEAPGKCHTTLPGCQHPLRNQQDQ